MFLSWVAANYKLYCVWAMYTYKFDKSDITIGSNS